MLLYPPRSARKRRALENKYRELRARSRFMFDAVYPLADIGRHVASMLALDGESRVATLGYKGSPSSAAVIDCAPVFAVKAGVVTGVFEEADGIRVRIDHCNGFLTEYSALTQSVFAASATCSILVARGSAIGAVSVLPHARQLRFEVHQFFRDHLSFPIAMDPTSLLARWSHLSLEISSAQKAA